MSTYYPPSVTIPVYAVFTAVGIGLTALRFWTRRVYLRMPIGADDWLMAFGMFVVSCCTAIQFYNSLYGTGGEALRPDEAASRAHTSHRINFTMIVIEKPAFGAIKLSLLFFYKRIFGIWPSFRRVNNVLIGLIVLWTAAFAIADLLLCGTHLEMNFAEDQSLAGEQCGDKGLLLLLFAVTGVVTDLFVLGLPFLYIRRLQMAKQKKWAAAVVILLGFISTFAGVLRTIFLSIAYPLGRMDWGYVQPPRSETPMVLLIFNPTFWVMMEMLLGAWAANLPPLGPLLRAMNLAQVVKSIGSTYRSSRRGSDLKTWEEESASHVEEPAPRIPPVETHGDVRFDAVRFDSRV